MVPLLRVGQQTITSADMMPLLARYNLLPQLIREILIEQAIAPVNLTSAEMDAACAAFYESQQVSDPELRQQWLQQTGYSAQQIVELVSRPLRLQRLKESRWGNRVESDFLTQKQEYDQLVYSLLRSQEPGLIQELYFRIQEGEASFSELARQHSEGPESQTSGLIGPVPMTQPHPLIADKLKHSQPGLILPPLQLDQWFVLVRLEQYIPATLDATIRQKLLDQRFEAWLKAAVEQVLSAPPPVLPKAPAPTAIKSMPVAVA
jgi:parvulin-like peptidyl-prolyl isomerase